MRDHLGRVAVLLDLAAVEPDHSVTELVDRLHVVGDEDNRPPGAAEVLHPAKAALLELGVADREHLVDEEDLGLQMGGDREREPHAHAARVALDRRVEELSTPENSTIWSSLRVDLARFIPRIDPFRKMFSRPVSSGLKPVPTSRRLPTRPRIIARPLVGVVIRVSTLSSVDLPAPFRPITPTASPSANVEAHVPQCPEILAARRSSSLDRRAQSAVRESESRSVPYAACIWPMRYRFESSCASIAKAIRSCPRNEARRSGRW